MKYFDYIFKIAMMIIAFGFLCVYYLSLDNNRYSFKAGNEYTIFDSKEGAIYQFVAEAKPPIWLKVSPKSSKVYPLKKDD